jgi:uncharacterized protein (TIGR03435 family)
MVTAVAALAGAVAFGQAAGNPTFDAVTIKPFPRNAAFQGYRGGPGSKDPGRVSWSPGTLLDLIRLAYGVQQYQVIAPDWLGRSRWDIAATLRDGTTNEQFRIMLRNLLADRFGVKLHHEVRDFPDEELVVAKGGPKLTETTLDASAPPFDAYKGRPKLDSNGFPELDGAGVLTMTSPDRAFVPVEHTAGRAATMAMLADELAHNLGRPVIDRTGLPGKYDFAVAYGLNSAAPPAGPPVDDPAQAVSTALQQQLGLKLASAKAQLDVIVVDHAEKTPTDN